MVLIPFDSLISGPKVFYVLEGSTSVLQISLLGFVAAGGHKCFTDTFCPIWLATREMLTPGAQTPMSPLVLWGSMYVHCGTLLALVSLYLRL